MKFSIIIATYNRRKLLSRAVSSVLNQTYKNWELIIVDDGSTDRTKDDFHLWKNKKVSHYTLKHQGIVKTHNFAIGKAKGKFVTFLDSDDYYHPEHLEKHAKEINCNPSVSLFYGGVRVLGSKMIPDATRKGGKINAEKCTLGGTFFVKNEVLKKVGGFAEVSYAADHELYMRLREKKYKVKKLYLKTYYYDRTHGDEITKHYMVSS
jgi:glycosyltransferase involved in cell wall biosynthesis